MVNDYLSIKYAIMPIITPIINTAPIKANGNQNGNHTQNQVKVSGNTFVAFKIKKTSHVIQHKLSNENVDIVILCLFCII